MKRRVSAVLLFALLGAIGVPRASAGTLYDNGALDGNIGAWNITDITVSNSFVLLWDSTLNSAAFVFWAVPGDTIASVDWSITSDPLDGNIFASGTASSLNQPLTQLLTATYNTTNVFQYELYNVSFSLPPDVLLGAGTYFFQLQNGATTLENTVLWDQNDGSSQANISLPGNPNLSDYGSTAKAACAGFDQGSNTCTYSETFQLAGSAPEPANFVMLGTGLIGIAALLRRRGRGSR